MHRGPFRVALATLIFTFALSTGPAFGAGLHWGRAQTHHGVSATQLFLQDMSCVGDQLCVAVSSNGVALTTTHPAADTGWHGHTVDARHGLGAISCPSTTLCVASDDSGRLLVTRSPTGAASGWTPLTGLISTNAEAGTSAPVACPDATLCVVGNGSNLVTSTAPAGTPGAWTKALLSTNAYVLGVSCPTTTYCAVLADNNIPGGGIGYSIWTSTDPAAGPSSYTAGALPSDLTPDRIVCSAPRVCLVGGEDEDQDALLDQATPGATPASAWTLATVAKASAGYGNEFRGALRGPRSPQTVTPSPYEFSCTAASCLAVEGATAVNPAAALITTSPGSGPSSWHAAPVATSNPGLSAPVGLSCTAALCAYGSSGAIYSTTTPATGQWRESPSLNPVTKLTGVACTPGGACLAVDAGGDALYSAHATAAKPVWSLYPTGLSSALSVSCVTGFCGIGGADSSIAWSATPGTAAWHSDQLDATFDFEDDTPDLVDISCAARNVCAALPRDWYDLGGDGVDLDPLNVFRFSGATFSYRQYGNKVSWIARAASGSVACPSTTQCLLVEPTGVGSALAKGSPFTRLSLGHGQAAIACAGTRFCAIATRDGRVLTSTRPTGGTRTWHTVTVDAHHTVSAIACGSARLCAAIDSAGRVVVSTDPAAARPAWRLTKLGAGLTAVGCSAHACLVTDGTGRTYTGR